MRTKVVGWGPFPWPGERRRRAQAAAEADRMMALARGSDGDRRAPVDEVELITVYTWLRRHGLRIRTLGRSDEVTIEELLAAWRAAPPRRRPR